ncbi:MAG: nitroreductase family deazaflavin-dependent oxidoreductase [Frankiales bacterium]|nr:nitroreductase family deazaflavin-dependent oxidoreductase [Frankiales bacterium]
MTEPGGQDDAQRALAARLARIALHEERVRANPFTAVMRRLGRTAGFARVYRRVGPVIDPRIRSWRDGRVMAAVYGIPILVLHTTGARSGAPRSSPLVYVRDGDDVMLLGTNFGQPKHPGWTANLLAHPQAVVDIGPEHLHVRAELVDDATFERLFPAFVAEYPGYADYLGRRDGLAPRMFRLRPVASPGD